MLDSFLELYDVAGGQRATLIELQREVQLLRAPAEKERR